MKMSSVAMGISAVAILAGVAGCGTQSHPTADATVATINHTTVTKSQLTNFVLGTEFMQGASFPSTTKEQKLEAKALVAQEAANQWALSHHLITQKKAQAQANTILKSQIESQTGGSSGLTSLLKSHKMTLSQFKSYLVQEVISDSAYSKAIKGVKAPTLQQEQAFYNANKSQDFTNPPQDELSDILVKTSSLANQILSQAKSGTSFATLAKKYSIASNGKKGGSLGYEAVSATSMSQGLYSAVQTMKVGQYATYKGTQGYHVIWLQATKPASVQSFASVKSEIQSQLQGQADDAAYQTWVNNLEKHDKITYAKNY